MPTRGSTQTKLNFKKVDSQKENLIISSSEAKQQTPSSAETIEAAPADAKDSRKRQQDFDKDKNTVHKKTKAQLHDNQDTAGSFTIDEAKGDLFASAPENAVLIHACNCQGSWGGGIASAFRSKYPNAYKHHRNYCQQHVQKRTTRSLVGTSQLIAPMGDNKNHFIGCVFTSNRYGRAKDKPKDILQATQTSIEALLKQINDWNAKHDDSERVSAIYMCKINSGLFSVPWKDTKALLASMTSELKDMDRVFMVRDRS